MFANMSAPEEPQLELSLDNKDFVATRHNTTLYTFAGSLATFNHVFLSKGEEEEGQTVGSYVFSHVAAYTGLKAFIQHNDLPQLLNMNVVPECDQEAYVASQVKDMDTIDDLSQRWEFEV
jgi:hypothetical protein